MANDFYFSRMAPQSKSQNEKHKAILAQLLQREDNKYCADCKAKSPRWASWNLGKSSDQVHIIWTISYRPHDLKHMIGLLSFHI